MDKTKSASDDENFDKELALLESLRWSRKEFLDRICAASASTDESVLAVLRHEATYQLAEFFFLLHARKIETEADIGRLAELHNQYIVDVTKDPQKIKRLGLTKERVLDAMFTSDTLPRLLQNWRDKRGSIDQSNLARLLVTVMSTETCRKILMACAKGGFIERERTAYGTVVVTSNGKLEALFGGILRELGVRLRIGSSEHVQSLPRDPD